MAKHLNILVRGPVNRGDRTEVATVAVAPRDDAEEKALKKLALRCITTSEDVIEIRLAEVDF